MNGLPVFEMTNKGLRATQNGVWVIGKDRQDALRLLRVALRNKAKRATAERKVRERIYSGETPSVFTSFTTTGGEICISGLKIGLGQTRAEAFANALGDTKPITWLFEKSRYETSVEGHVTIHSPFMKVTGKDRKQAEDRLRDVVTSIIDWIFQGKKRLPLEGRGKDDHLYHVFTKGRWGTGETVKDAQTHAYSVPPQNLSIEHFLPVSEEPAVEFVVGAAPL
jgi:hypothetical protein